MSTRKGKLPYEIGNQIGSGSFGNVYLARDVSVSPPARVVVKMSHANMTAEEGKFAVREADVLSELHHPFIVKFLGSWAEGGRLSIALEYCDGGDLDHLIRSYAQAKRFLEESRIRRYLLNLLLALFAIHRRKLIHRDIKCANILLVKDEDVVKLADFGLCSILPSSLAFAQSKVGTPLTVAPEILSEQSLYNTKVDVWSLGVVLYQLMTLRVPFTMDRGVHQDNFNNLFSKIVHDEPQTIESIVGSKRYSKDLCQMCMFMLTKHPRDRPSARALLSEQWIKNDLQELLAHSNIKKEIAVALAATHLAANDERIWGELFLPLREKEHRRTEISTT